MPRITKHVPGTFCWVELMTPDAEVAKDFYRGLFGWTFTDTPAGEGNVYTICQLDGDAVAGLAEIPDQIPRWNAYISVENADLTVSKARKLGARFTEDPFDAMENGRMAIMQDPQGAYLFVWEPRKLRGAQRIDEPGTLCWTELATHDVHNSSQFYSELFGWKAVTSEEDGMMDTLFMQGENIVAGVFPMGEELKEVPSHWSVYFGVENCKESVDTARSLGASVLIEPTPVGNFGCFAFLRDFQGTYFGIVCMEDESCVPSSEQGCCSGCC